MITYFIREATSTGFKKKIKYILHSSKATSRRTQNKTQTFQIVIKNTAQNKTPPYPGKYYGILFLMTNVIDAEVQTTFLLNMKSE